MTKIKFEDFLPKKVELETNDGIIEIFEPTVEDLLNIQKITNEIENGELNEVEGAIAILSILAKGKEKEFAELLSKLPYSKLVELQNKIFKELGLGQNEAENEIKNK